MVSRKDIIFEKLMPYHIIIRAIDGRNVFDDEIDCYRFIFQMFVGNVGSPAFNLHRKDVVKAAKALLMGEEIPEKLIVAEHQPLVHLLSFVLVVNHSHLVLVPNTENGIPKYIQKLKGGFTKYYNLKHDRRSNLFERPYKIVPIQNNFQADAILGYVNIKNPLDVYQPLWRENGLKNEKEALNFLREYQFSSFPDLFWKRKSRILAPASVQEMYFGEGFESNRTNYENFVRDYLQQKLISNQHLFLEEY